MSTFINFLEIGIQHILDINGLDHFLFILSFSLLYPIKRWKALVGLVTAFTVGHTITLIISGLNILVIAPYLVEKLIPVTILISCIYNYYIILGNKNNKGKMYILYLILLCFGLIHGMGFSNYLRSILFEDDAILLPLLSLNLGIEVAQIAIVILFVLFKEVLYKTLPQKTIHLIINSIVSVSVFCMLF